MNENKIKLQLKIIQAAQDGNLNTIKKYVEDGGDVTFEDNYIIQWAAYHDHFHIVSYLADNGADINSSDDLVFRLAAKSGELNLMIKLIGKGVDISAEDNDALINAAEHGHLNVVQYLIVEQGLDIDIILSSDDYDIEEDIIDWAKQYKEAHIFKETLDNDLVKKSDKLPNQGKVKI